MKRPASKAQFVAVVIIALMVLASVGFLIYQQLQPKQPAVSAVVSIDGIEVCTVDLSKDVEPYDIDLDALFGVGVVLEVKEHEIHFKSSTCPDQICVHAGWLWRDMDIAVCMPNKVSVMVVPTADLPG
ncbi:NusG domain II-containing protein [Oscillospiraceae bacterium LTW-04]|nr:NusG domain II-containing protein [Oscillospiraceae bacterium MB24-C1]